MCWLLRWSASDTKITTSKSAAARGVAGKSVHCGPPVGTAASRISTPTESCSVGRGEAALLFSSLLLPQSTGYTPRVHRIKSNPEGKPGLPAGLPEDRMKIGVMQKKSKD